MLSHGFSRFSSVQSLNRVRLFATPWIAARQASLSITNSRSSLRLMSIESVMPSSHLILCCPLLLLSPIPPSIRVFSNESPPQIPRSNACWSEVELNVITIQIEYAINVMCLIIQNPPPLPVEKLSSTKLAPGARKTGDHCSKWLGFPPSLTLSS